MELCVSVVLWFCCEYNKFIQYINTRYAIDSLGLEQAGREVDQGGAPEVHVRYFLQ